MEGSTMPTISLFYGILIQMFWGDHAPPHFHALYAEYETIIDIRTLKSDKRKHAETSFSISARVGLRTQS